MDLWMQIKATEANIRKGQIAAAKQAKAIAKKKKEQQDEMIEWTVIIAFCVVLLGAMLWGGWELLMWCKKVRCGA
jgi:type VI protein secretion system component VasF